MKKGQRLKVKGQRHPQGGFIAFTSMIVIAAVVLAVSVSVALLGVGEVNAAFSYKKGQEALKAAEGCMDNTLLRLRDDASFSSETLSLGDASCTISVSGSGASKTIDVTATIAVPPDYTRKLQVTTKRTGNSINVLTWSEVE
jgi:hypothetical protein